MSVQALDDAIPCANPNHQDDHEVKRKIDGRRVMRCPVDRRLWTEPADSEQE